MTNYHQTINGKQYEYFYDTNERHWTVLDAITLETIDTFYNKAQMLEVYPFTFVKI